MKVPKNWRTSKIGIRNDGWYRFADLLLGTAVMAIIGSFAARSKGSEWSECEVIVDEDGRESVYQIGSDDWKRIHNLEQDA